MGTSGHDMDVGIMLKMTKPDTMPRASWRGNTFNLIPHSEPGLFSCTSIVVSSLSLIEPASNIGVEPASECYIGDSSHRKGSRS